MDNLSLNDWLNDDEFDEAWEDEEEEQNFDTPPTKYQYTDGVARCKQIAMLLGVFFHAVHGEKSMDILENNIFPETRISFHLNEN